MDAARLRVYLGRMLESFRSCAEAKASFEPEHQACAEIVRLFEAQGIDGESLREAVAIMNRVSETAHYNGSLWFDLQAQLAVSCCDHGVVARVRAGGSHAEDRGIEIEPA